MINMLDFQLEDLKKWLKENGEKEFRGKQVFEWINKGEFDFNEMKNLPESVRNKLISAFSMSIPEVTKKLESSDNSTSKFLLRYSDGNIIEAVVMKYKHGNTICVSTQVGCRMGCKFCASTIGGLIRNLSSGEILGQILTVQKHLGERISNVVLMGSGEPLDNYENVLKFIKSVNDDQGLNIGQRHITLSTCGIVPNIKDLADSKFQITLAISLHAAKDELRKTMMPVANKYSLEEIMDACVYYINKTNRRITFEYALVRGVNDSKENAKQLIKLIRGLLCHVNLIPINEIKENEYKKSSTDNVIYFSNMLKDAGIETTVRREMGADIEAACGQLKRSYLEGKILLERV